MTTSRLISIALAGAVLAVPAAAQAAPSKPPSHLRLGSSAFSKVTNPKAKKTATRKVRARSSWLYDGSSGRPGSVTVTTPVHVIDLPLWSPYGYVYSKALQNSNGPTVSRSPATTMLAVPLLRDGRSIGVLTILDRKDGGAFGVRDLERAALFAELVVTVLPPGDEHETAAA